MMSAIIIAQQQNYVFLEVYTITLLCIIQVLGASARLGQREDELCVRQLQVTNSKGEVAMQECMKSLVHSTFKRVETPFCTLILHILYYL